MDNCPRKLCKGQLEPDTLEYNLWTCLLCARQYMKRDGKFILIREAGLTVNHRVEGFRYSRRKRG